MLLACGVAAPGCGKDQPLSPAGPPPAVDAGSEDGPTVAASPVVDGVLLLPIAPPVPADLPTGIRDRLDACRRAAAAAEDVHLALGGPGWLAVRDTLEQILAFPGDAPPAILGRIRDFAVRFFLWHGSVDPGTGRRLRPRFIPGELAAAAEAAALAGAALPLPETAEPAATRTERLEALLARIRPLLFPARGSGPGEPGDASVPQGEDEGAGEAEAALARVRQSLAAAGVPLAAPVEGSRPGQLVTGGLGPDLAVIVGFRGPQDEPGFGALLAVPEPRSAAVVAALTAGEKALRRGVEDTGGGKVPAGRTPPRALVPVSVVEATGAFGPLLEAGLFPLLDGPLVADPDGDRLLLAVNLARTLDEAEPIRALVGSSSPDDETGRRRLEQRACARLVRHALAAVAGGGTDGTERRPPGFLANRLGRAAPVMEQLRALLAALHLAGAPELAGALPGGAECSRAVLDDFAASAVEHLLDTPAGREGPAAVARRVALGGLLAGGGLESVEREGRVVLRVADEGKLRQDLAGMLGEVRRIRYAGDGEAARGLIARHGSIPAAWRAAAESLSAAIGGIAAVAFVYPSVAAGASAPGVVEARVERARRRALGLDPP
jgi:hypothetical protein